MSLSHGEHAYTLTLECDLSEEASCTTGPVLCVPQPEFFDIELRHVLEMAGIEPADEDHFRVDPSHPETGSLTIVAVLDSDAAARELVDTLSLLCSRRTVILLDEIDEKEGASTDVADGEHRPLHLSQKGRP